MAESTRTHDKNFKITGGREFQQIQRKTALRGKILSRPTQNRHRSTRALFIELLRVKTEKTTNCNRRKYRKTGSDIVVVYQ